MRCPWRVWPLLLACSAALPAAELVALDVERDGRVIQVSSELHIAAPRSLVYAILSDYERLPQLSSRFKESRVEQGADSSTWVYTVVEGCVLFFCRSVARYAQLETQPDTMIMAIVDPARSDFELGEERWELATRNDTTVVHYTHTLEPKFWVPPVIGVWVIRKTLREDALKAASRIERMAAAQAR